MPNTLRKKGRLSLSDQCGDSETEGGIDQGGDWLHHGGQGQGRDQVRGKGKGKDQVKGKGKEQVRGKGKGKDQVRGSLHQGGNSVLQDPTFLQEDLVPHPSPTVLSFRSEISVVRRRNRRENHLPMQSLAIHLVRSTPRLTLPMTSRSSKRKVTRWQTSMIISSKIPMTIHLVDLDFHIRDQTAGERRQKKQMISSLTSNQ